MKNLTCFFILAMVLLSSCKDSETYSHVHVYNGFNDPVDFILNNERHQIQPNENAYFKSPKRSQLFEFGQEKQLIKTKENASVLINLAKDTIIKEEVLYMKGHGGGSTLKRKIPDVLINLRGKKFFGPYELILNSLVVKNFDFTINEDLLTKVNANVLEADKILHKISSVEEFIRLRRSLNDSQDFISQILMASAKILNDDISLKMQQQVIFVNNAGESIGDIGEARVAGDDTLELFGSSRRIYNKQKDGEVKETIIILPKVNIVLDDGTKKNRTRVDVVLCSNHRNPRIVVR